MQEQTAAPGEASVKADPGSLPPESSPHVETEAAAGTTAAVCGTADGGEATDPDEYEVYYAVVMDRFWGDDIQTVVVEDMTTIGHAKDEEALATGLKNAGKYIEKKMKGTKADTLKDFEKKNASMHPVCLDAFLHPQAEGSGGKKIVHLGPDFALISQAEVEKIFSGEDGWHDFYEIFPASQGILTFSRVGFNGKKTQALVYAGNQADWLAGAGFYLLLEKKNDFRWRVVAEVTAWIS